LTSLSGWGFGGMRFKSALVGALIAGLSASPAAAKVAGAPASAPATRYASIVVDFESGKVLYERNADFSRYPASLTKIMTLYLTFESLKAGRIKLEQPMRVSEYAAGRDPSRLGLTPGGTLTVEQAIRGMTTKSANDAASVIAEHLGGCEQKFAELMTAKGKALGMTQTVFYNASGLPAAGHVSSARDLSILARALIRDFPEYYHYVSLNDFEYRGKHWPNQNRFLRTYFGADGIKTGFIYSSGHNLAASAKRGENKRLIAIVLGGDTAGWTREHASRLMDIAYASIDPNLIVVADTKPERAPMEEVTDDAKPIELPSLASGTAPVVPVLPSEQGTASPAVAAAQNTELPPAVTSPSPATAMLLTAASSDAKKPTGEKPKAQAFAPAAPVVAAVQPAAPAAVAAAPASSVAASASTTPAAAAAVVVKSPAAATAAARPAPASATAAIKSATASAPKVAAAKAAGPVKAAAATILTATAAAAPVPVVVADSEAAIEQGDGPAGNPPPAAATPAPEGWSVQVGVFKDAGAARQRAEEIRGKMPVQLRTAHLLVGGIGDGVHVSSRFAMVNEKDARQACTELQRGRVPCVVIPPGRPMVVSAN